VNRRHRASCCGVDSLSPSRCPAPAEDMVSFQQISDFHFTISFKHILGTICFGGGRFSQNEGQGNTQEAMQRFNHN
jgi:hypothetical protein